MEGLVQRQAEHTHADEGGGHRQATCARDRVLVDPSLVLWVVDCAQPRGQPDGKRCQQEADHGRGKAGEQDDRQRVERLRAHDAGKPGHREARADLVHFALSAARVPRVVAVA